MMPSEGREQSAPAFSAPDRVGPGAQLRAAREATGLSLEQAAQQLKLAPRQVKALEEEDFAQLPGRTFARGFVRNYARLLNLDGEDLLAQLPDAVRAPALGPPALQATGAMIAELPTARVAPPSFSRWLIPLVFVACIVGAAVYEWYRGGLSPPSETRRSALPAPAATVMVEAGSSAPAQPPPAATVVEPAGSSGPGQQSPGVDKPAAAPVAPTVGESAPAAASAASAAAAAAPAAAPTQGPPAAAAVEPAPLQLRYRGPSWTEIRDRDGQVLVSRLFAQNSEQSIRGSAPFDIVIGNARAVTLVYRGEPVDLSRNTRQNVARLRLN